MGELSRHRSPSPLALGPPLGLHDHEADDHREEQSADLKRRDPHEPALGRRLTVVDVDEVRVADRWVDRVERLGVLTDPLLPLRGPVIDVERKVGLRVDGVLRTHHDQWDLRLDDHRLQVEERLRLARLILGQQPLLNLREDAREEH